MSGYSAEYYAKNRERFKAYRANWLKTHPEKQRQYDADRQTKRREFLLRVYGGQCRCCGETNSVFLEFDHIYNDGWAERRNGRSTSVNTLMRDFQKFGVQLDRIQILCANCHTAKTKLGMCDRSMHRPTSTSLESCSMEQPTCQQTLTLN